MGLGRGNVCISTTLLVADSWVVPIFPRGIGNVHRSVAWSFVPAKITVPLYHTSHFLLSNTTLHPALHKGQIPIREAIFNDGTMCPVNVCGSPGIWMSHTWVDRIVVPSGKFILSGLVAMRLLSTSALSMMNIAVAPVSTFRLEGQITFSTLYLHTLFNTTFYVGIIEINREKQPKRRL
jgi:hypothetical protein